LALVELPTLLADDERSGLVDLPDPLPSGARTQRAYASRIARLEATTRRALLYVAAHGQGRPDALRVALHAAGCGVDALEPAEAAGLVVIQDGDVRFCHPLMRAAVYHGASG